MQYNIEFKPRAIKDLKSLTLREREKIVAKVEALQTNLAGDVKRRKVAFQHQGCIDGATDQSRR